MGALQSRLETDMVRRQTPTVLLYCFGLILLLSLSFNGYLLMGQSGRPSHAPEHESEMVGAATAASPDLQEQLRACDRNNHHKDSLIHVLENGAHETASQAR